MTFEKENKETTKTKITIILNRGPWEQE